MIHDKPNMVVQSIPNKTDKCHGCQFEEAGCMEFLRQLDKIRPRAQWHCTGKIWKRLA